MSTKKTHFKVRENTNGLTIDKTKEKVRSTSVSSVPVTNRKNDDSLLAKNGNIFAHKHTVLK